MLDDAIKCSAALILIEPQIKFGTFCFAPPCNAAKITKSLKLGEGFPRKQLVEHKKLF